MKTFLFPGQGSQVRGMGVGLFEAFPDLTRRASEILGYSIRELCLDDPRRQLAQTQFTQPALYVVSALSYLKRVSNGGAPPDMFAGHSLGEFNALMAAGCFDFELGLRLVKKRGELMGRVADGAMAAIMSVSNEKVSSILRERGSTEVDIVIYNSPLQCVVAGRKEELAKLEPLFREAGALYYPLNTSGAFHSRFMQPVSEEFRAYLRDIQFAPLQKRVIANVTAQPYRDADIVDNLVAQLSRPVRWQQSMQYLLEVEGMEFEEIGHGDVLTKLLEKNRQQAPRTGASQSNGGVTLQEGTQNRQHQALEKVRAWNTAHPVGTRVRSSIVQGQDLETRTQAVVLFGHRAAVYMKGYNGYFDLEQIEAAAGN